MFLPKALDVSRSSLQRGALDESRLLAGQVYTSHVNRAANIHRAGHSFECPALHLFELHRHVFPPHRPEDHSLRQSY